MNECDCLLGSLMAGDMHLDEKLGRCIARAMFENQYLSVNTKRLVYQSCILSVLLYRSECWTLLRRHLE